MDALTLTPSLRAAETCNLANHRYVPLQGGKDMRQMGAGSITTWKIPAIASFSGQPMVVYCSEPQAKGYR
jgi:hypothetical protein